MRCSAVGCAWASPHARRRCLASRAVTPAAPYVRFCTRWLRARPQHGMCWDVTSLSVRVATPSLGQPRIDRTANGALVDSMITTRRPAYARGCFRLCPRRPRRLRRLDGLCMCGCWEPRRCRCQRAGSGLRSGRRPNRSKIVLDSRSVGGVATGPGTQRRGESWLRPPSWARVLRDLAYRTQQGRASCAGKGHVLGRTACRPESGVEG